MTTLLALDTATAACSVALSVNGEISQLFEVAPRRHGERLLPMIDQLLQEATLSIKDCDAIAFGQGPGSFMGLRIAAGVAQGLAFGVGIPVIPVSSLQALAQSVYWQTRSNMVLAGWDARMQQIYWGLYEAREESMETLVFDQLTSPSEICISQSSCIAAGNAWEVYARYLPRKILALPRPKQDCYPTAKAIAFLAEKKFDKGSTMEPQEIDIAYLRNTVTHLKA